MKEKLSELVEALIQGDTKKAEAALHEYLTVKTKAILEADVVVLDDDDEDDVEDLEGGDEELDLGDDLGDEEDLDLDSEEGDVGLELDAGEEDLGDEEGVEDIDVDLDVEDEDEDDIELKLK